MGGYLMNAPGIVGMVIGFLLLDERDARTLTALRVTPVSVRRYLAYRISFPLFVATATTLLGYPLIEITALPFGQLLAISVVAGMSAPLIALVLATAAPNKVAGLALVKVLRDCSNASCCDGRSSSNSEPVHASLGNHVTGDAPEQPIRTTAPRHNDASTTPAQLNESIWRQGRPLQDALA